MHIIYLGVISRPEDIGRIGEASVAGNKMQYNLLKYLSRYEDLQIDVVSFHPYKAFPHCKKLWIPKTKEQLFDNVDLWQVGYPNLPVIKQLIIPLTTRAMAKKLIRSKDDVIMLYDMYPNQGVPMAMLRKSVNDRTVCLLADLSIGGVVKEKGLRKFLRKFYDRSTLSNMKKCGNYIVLNENAAKAFVPHSQYMVMDGGIEPSEYAELTAGWNSGEKNIIYTGALVDYSGIMNLIAAMELLDDPSIVLDIYGDGVLRPEIQTIATQNPRIRYHGRVSNQEAMAAQQSAWLLANPRPTESHIAQVTFPSKIFEYLMSGRPVMTTRLNGFSADYDALLFWVDGNTPEALAACVNTIGRMDDRELAQRAYAARAYLLKHKTWEQNAHKVHGFLFDTLGETHESYCQPKE